MISNNVIRALMIVTSMTSGNAALQAQGPNAGVLFQPPIVQPAAAPTYIPKPIKSGKRKFQEICPHFASQNKGMKWTGKYNIFIFDAENYNNRAPEFIYWKPSNSGDNPVLEPIPSETQGPRVLTSQTILGLVCNTAASTDFTITSVDTQMPSTNDATNMLTASYTMSLAKGADPSLDFLYSIKPVTANTLSEIDVTGLAPKGLPKVPDIHRSLTLAGGGTTPIIGWVLIERHVVVHYGLGGGFVATRATPITYANVSTPTSIVTTTNTTKTTTLVTNPPPPGSGGSSGATCTGATNSNCTQTTSSESTTQIQNTTGTQNYLLGTRSSQWQINALAGITVYPFGRDTYLNGDHFRYIRFDPYSLKNEIGVFVGTSVNTVGNFTVAPSLEIFPGTQLMAGVTWWNKTTPVPGITPCSGYGVSPSYQVVPTSSTNDTVTTNTYASTTSSTIASTTTTQTSTTITTSATSGCKNGNVATFLSGTSVPTQTGYAPAFSVGITFNTNLAKGFQGFFK